MEVVKWQYKNPYHDKRTERERLFIFGPHTVTIAQHPTVHIDIHQNTGFIVWDGAYILAKFVHERLDLVGKSCLELGAGSALVSVVAYLCSAARVVATDMSEYLPFIRTNIERNLGSMYAATQQKPVRVCELFWGSKTDDIEPADVVLGSEILYLADQHDALLATLAEVMHAQSTAYFVYKERNLGEHTFAAKATQRGFAVKELSRAFIDEEFRDNKDERYHLLRISKIKQGM
ncbi:Methyltransferase-like protein 21B [Coemansia sp. RSA 1813]|nr:Methyltransferase-like protein 21B [Coemansia sp. RSA 1843]KAJ2090768.1 Methyltransferase-like protein 21B [Coemansia sp. RSA 986]KAJ2570430.1 Methyltransferase-like protein 21B [Coemansia sp. RSA 1813]